jgi:hypothetical protein
MKGKDSHLVPVNFERIPAAGFYYLVVDAMLKTGFSPDEIGKIGGANYLRIFDEAVKSFRVLNKNAAISTLHPTA